MMKTAKTMKKLLCLLLTLCIALSCVMLSVSAADEPIADDPVPETAKTALPITCTYASVWDSEGYLVTRMYLDFAIASKTAGDEDAKSFDGVFDTIGKDARLPITYTLFGYTVASGYAVPVSGTYTDEDGTEKAYVSTHIFDLFAADGTPGIKLAKIKAAQSYDKRYYLENADFDMFELLVYLPEGVFSGEKNTSEAVECLIEPDDVPVYDTHVIPDWMLSGFFMVIQIVSPFAQKHPKLWSFLMKGPAWVIKLLTKCLDSMSETLRTADTANKGDMIKVFLLSLPGIVVASPFTIRLAHIYNHLLRDVYGTTFVELFKANTSK